MKMQEKKWGGGNREEGGRDGKLLFYGDQASVWENEKVLEMGWQWWLAKHGEHTKTHWIVHVDSMNLTVCGGTFQLKREQIYFS